MSNQPVICFIDDDEAEVEAFKSVFSDDFTVIANKTPQSVLSELKSLKLKANLFVLDLYFSDGPASSSEECNRMIELKSKVDVAQKELSDYLFTICQSRDGGLKIMKYIRDNYPATPIVFYTRKGTLADAVVCIDNGADGIFPKASIDKFDHSTTRVTQIESAARLYHDALATHFFCKASTSDLFKKFIKVSKFVWKNWKKF